MFAPLSDLTPPAKSSISRVMGGKSSSSFVIEDGVARFTGTCAIVDSLNAPGFVTLQTGRREAEHFPDVSSCSGLMLSMRSNVDYDGYRVSFGTRRDGMRHGMGFKAPALNNVSREFTEVIVPFSVFSLNWDEGTGDIITPCNDESSFCPDEGTLRNFEAFAFWGEGVGGDISLDIKSIKAVGCADTPASILQARPKPFWVVGGAMVLGYMLVKSYLKRREADMEPESSSTIYGTSGVAT